MKKVFLALFAWSLTSLTLAQEPTKIRENRDHCGPSILLEKPEYAFGPPSVPTVVVSATEHANRKKRFKAIESNADQLFELGYLAFQLGDYQNAETYFRMAAKTANFKIPFYGPTTNYWLAQTYEKSGNLDAAREYYLKYSDVYYLHLINARISEKVGDLKNAEREYLLAQSVQLYEMVNYDPYKLLAEMFFKHGDYANAKKYILNYLTCAEYERKSGGSGYLRANNQHIVKARQFLMEIEARLIR